MAKKKPATLKKSPTSKKSQTSKKSPTSKKTTAPAKKTATAQKKTSSKTTTAKKSPIIKKTATIPVKQANTLLPETNVSLINPGEMSRIKGQIERLMSEFRNISDNNLTLAQRRRKIGAGIRNYGFIDKASDLADANPQYAQFFDPVALKSAIRNIEMCREIVILLQSFTRMVSNSMMVYSDEAFSMALIFYNSVKELARRGDPEAIQLFRALQPFFRRPRRTGTEPTVKELERDLHALIHGKADGKIIVENERPKTSSGKRLLIDEVSRSRAAFKETEEAEIVE
jgi:hypothetical protein